MNNNSKGDPKREPHREPLPREEYIEQAYFYRAVADRIKENGVAQELMTGLRDELLSTSKLPMAIEFLVCEMKFTGRMAPAMERLSHYFHPFQIYLIEQAEDDHARLEFTTAMRILEKEAEYRSRGPTPQGLFLYQFETLCRHRLGYDRGLRAIARDPIYDESWREWIDVVRREVGLIDFADLLYSRSEYFAAVLRREGREPAQAIALFGEKEGKIAFGNRRKDPLFLFAALERHLGYPPVPRPTVKKDAMELLPDLIRTVKRLEQQVKL
ncbi:MAG TPA: hypothetical protein VGE52_13775, partial [Pirellulales bacterium]